LEAPIAKNEKFRKNGVTRKRQQCRTGLPNEQADVPLATYVVTVTAKSGTRGEMLRVEASY
jgi:hypothetical protein